MQGYRPSTYGDGFADVYDEWYPRGPETDAAVAGLRRLAGPGPVLELGCGTGRLCLPLAATGLAVVGIDASEAMLARLRRKPGAEHVTTVVADMAAFDVGDRGRFRLVFAAFNTLFNLATAEQQAACFAAARRHLHPEGCFAIECFVPGGVAGDPSHDRPDEEPREPGAAGAGEAAPGTRPTGSGAMAGPAGTHDAIELRAIAADRVVLRISRQDPVRQTVSGQHVELSAADGVRLRPWHLRYAGPDELDRLAEAAGLALSARWAGWSGEPFGDDAPQHVSVYRPRR